jgi:two-component system sensor histidine kinase DctS
MASIVDISDRKAAEAEAVRQQERIQATARLVAMGEVASGLAHELNQPLAAISSYCAGALRVLQGKDPANEVIPALGRAVEQTKRAGQIIRRMYSLARRDGGTAEPINLAESLHSAISLLESAFKRDGIKVIDGFSHARAIINGDAVMLEQTLFNLLRNAADSMAEIDPSRRVVTIDLESRDDYAILSVGDEGSGIPVENRTRIFDPLFTTKTEGMGMGLSVCRTVVESHKGRMWFESRTGGGTIFYIRIPLLHK